MGDGDQDFDRFIGSFAGVDGGNPDADLWICGIEHGGALEDLGTKLQPEPHPGAWTPEFRADHPDFYRWQYHQKVAKLLIALEALLSGDDANPDLSPHAYRPYMAEKLYVEGGRNFKLNLFPLASPYVRSDAWAQAYRSHPYLEDKSTYYQRCREKRFPFFRQIRAQHAPKVIIGTGVTFKDAFASAFGFDGQPDEFVLSTSDPVARRCFRYQEEGAALYVTPFLGGPHGLNSNALITELARVIAMSHPHLRLGS